MAKMGRPSTKVSCTCIQCGNEFQVESYRVKNGTVKYCGRECARLGSIKRQICVCKHCGKEFEEEPAQIARGGGKYCNDACYRASQHKTIKGKKVNLKTIEVVCLYCKSPFLTDQWRIDNGWGKYCSKICAAKALENKIECKCKECGKLFYVKPSHVRKGVGKYCSKECYTKAGNKECVCSVCGDSFQIKTNRFKNGGGRYCSYKCFASIQKGDKHPLWRGGSRRYRGENWPQQRKLAYERDSGICQHCGAEKSVDGRKNAVHHIKRFSLFNDDYIAANNLTNLITLCSTCHSKAEHGIIPILQPRLL